MLFNLHINHFLHREKIQCAITYSFHCVVVYFSLYTDIPRYVKSINVQAGGPILRQGRESEVYCYKLQKCYRVMEQNKHETSL
jgi:hypothetical protein